MTTAETTMPAVDDDDDSWAAPRAKAGTGSKLAAGFLAAVLVGTIGFTVGAKVGEDRAQPSAGGFDRGALTQALGRGGFGRAAGAVGAPAETAATTETAASASSATTDTAAADLGALLPGLDADTSGETTVTGAITAVEGTTLTVTDEAGTQTRVAIGDATVVERTGAAALAPLAPGSTVTVTGTVGEDGVVTATQLTVT